MEPPHDMVATLLAERPDRHVMCGLHEGNFAVEGFLRENHPWIHGVNGLSYLPCRGSRSMTVEAKTMNRVT